MNLKIKSISIIIILILSVLIINLSINFKAKNLDNEINSISITRFNTRFSEDFLSWGDIEIISEPILNQNNNVLGSYDVKIAVENDKRYVVWNDKTNYNNCGENDDIFYRYFDGKNWSEIQVISEPIPGKDNSKEWSTLPDIAVENGKIFVVWQSNNNTDNSGSDTDIFFRCNLTGNSWEDIQVISEPRKGKNINIGFSYNPAIAVENGEIFIAWYDSNNTNNSGTDEDIFYRCNLTGFNWEDIQVISEPIKGKDINTHFSRFPDIMVENSNIYVVWQDNNNTFGAGTDRDIFYRCNLTGLGWECIQVISEPIFGSDLNTEDSEKPSVAVENGKIYIVWYDANITNNAGTDYDIFYRCNLTGFSWEDVQVISEPIPGNNINTDDSSYPNIAIENGRIYVVWQDKNNTNSAGTDLDIFFRCNITRNSWEDILIISEPVHGTNLNTGSSLYPNIEVNLGRNHILWQDANDTYNAGTDTDIFYRSISLTSVLSSPIVIPTTGNTSTEFNFTVTYFHLDNTPPTDIRVNISGIEYPMLEVNPIDNNYKDGKEYFFKIKNLDIGIHTFKFWAFDGFNKGFTELFNNPKVFNTPPNITTEDNLTVNEDVYFELIYEYEDTDNINVGQPGLWNFSTNASWLEFNCTTSVLNGTPTNDDVGEYWVNISVFDTIDIDFTNFTLTVLNINDPPIITTNVIATIYEDEYYQVDYEAVDIDTPQNNLRWSLDTNASWLRFDGITAVLNGTPTNDDVGKYLVSVSVSDNEFINYSNFTLQVVNVNDPPRIITKSNTTALEDEFYETIYQAQDVDNTPQELTWKISTNAKWLNYDILQAVINGTPTNDDVGEYWVNISVYDSEYFDYSNFTLTVINANDPPRIITADKTNITVSELYSVNYEAEDIDPTEDRLTWSLKTNTTTWLTIDKITGWLNGIPAKDDAGVYWVNVSLTDGEDGWDFHNFTLQVLKQPTIENNPPRLFNSSMMPVKGNINTKFTFSVQYFDAEGNNPEFIQLVLDESIYNMLLLPLENTSNGTYFTSIFLTEGTHDYYFMASDGVNIVRTENLTTPEVKGLPGAPQESAFWYWIAIIVVVIIIILLTFIFIFKKRKAAKIPVLRAELMKVAPSHLALPGEVSKPESEVTLPAEPAVLDQLPTPQTQAQGQQGVPIGGEGISEQLPPPLTTPIAPQYQLPKATLTKEQQLGLLRERFLRGEVTEETYNKLRAELEGMSDKDISLTEEKYQNQSEKEKQETSDLDEKSTEVQKEE